MTVSQTVLTDLFDLDQHFGHTQLNQLFDIVGENLSRIAGTLDEKRVGQALYAFNAPLAEDVEVGQPVYFDTSEQLFKKSQLSVLSSGGRVYASESSEAWGILKTRCSADSGHLLLAGIDTINLFNSAGQASPTGKFYLSTVAGQLVASPDHAIVVPVLLATGTGDIIFRPWFADTFPRYVPRLLTLTNAPAGNAVIAGGIMTIASPNASLQGWLPASHASFEGNQPSGAKFGYNLATDAVLGEAWPPLDPSLARMYHESGGTDSQGARVLLGNDSSRLVINEFGIWWMTDCPTQAPWTYPAEGATTGTCPKPAPRRLTLEADFGIHGAQLPSAITALSSRIPWLQFYREGTTNQANVGDLDLDIDADSLYGSDANIGALAIKSLDDGKFTRGPVVSGLKSSTPSLALSGGFALGGYRYGQLTLAIDPSRDFDLLPGETQLFGAQTEAYDATIAIGLPAGRNSSFNTEYHVPHTVSEEATIRFVFWLLSPTLIALPAGLQLSIRRFAEPDAGEQLVLPSSVIVPLNYTAGTQLQPGRFLRITSDLVTVLGGDMIYVSISRAGATDGVSGEVHVLKQYAKFENA